MSHHLLILSGFKKCFIYLFEASRFENSPKPNWLSAGSIYRPHCPCYCHGENPMAVVGARLCSTEDTDVDWVWLFNFLAAIKTHKFYSYLLFNVQLNNNNAYSVRKIGPKVGQKHHHYGWLLLLLKAPPLASTEQSISSRWEHVWQGQFVLCATCVHRQLLTMSRPYSSDTVGSSYEKTTCKSWFCVYMNSNYRKL